MSVSLDFVVWTDAHVKSMLIKEYKKYFLFSVDLGSSGFFLLKKGFNIFAAACFGEEWWNQAQSQNAKF